LPCQALRLVRAGRPDGWLRLPAGESLSLGRGTQVDLHFPTDAVSRLHAHLKQEGGAWLLTDVGSVNGTFVAAGFDFDADGASPMAAFAHGAHGAHGDVGAAFVRARPLQAGVGHALAVGDVCFLGDGHNAIVALAGGPHEQQGLASTAARPASARGRQLESELQRAARDAAPVLLWGRSGSGKTWAAQALHKASGRRGRFVALNTAALPTDPTALRSVLLGHRRGAFTGAIADSEGAWPAARDGTLLLERRTPWHRRPRPSCSRSSSRAATSAPSAPPRRQARPL
jgi:hypothetical protein